MARRWHAGPETPSLEMRKAGRDTRPDLRFSSLSPPAESNRRPILTMNLELSAVRTCEFAGTRQPARPNVCALFAGAYERVSETPTLDHTDSCSLVYFGRWGVRLIVEGADATRQAGMNPLVEPITDGRFRSIGR